VEGTTKKTQQKLILKSFSTKQVFQRKVKSSIKPRMRKKRQSKKLSSKHKTTTNHYQSINKTEKEQKLQKIAESNSKRAKINICRADNPHAFSRSEHNLRFTENKIRLKCFHFSYFHK
jgi:3-hydroxy-3-methylglutaryl CoA synthase